MHEQSVERSLREMADGEQPHPRVSIQHAIEHGRTRLRRRRLALTVGAPVLSAAVALAVALPAGLLSGTRGHGSSVQTGSYGKLVDGAFDPSYLAIKFGWLPKGSPVIDAYTSPGEESLSTQGSTGWLLSVYAPNACHVTTDGRALDCYPAGSSTPITRRGPAINGRKSLWLQGVELAWEYAPNAWSELTHETDLSGRAVAPRIARAVKYGQHVPVRFASRFTTLPRGWRIVSMAAPVTHGVYLAESYQLALLRTIGPDSVVGNSTPNEPIISTFPETAGNTCNIPRQNSDGHVTINGHVFTLARFPSTTVQVCSSDVGGLFASVAEIGKHQFFPPVQVMGRLQLLGPNSADWVTNPLPGADVPGR